MMNKWLFFSLILFCSCSKNSWISSQFQASSKSQSFLAVVYENERYPDLTVEFIQDIQSVKCYVILQRGAALPYQQLPQLTEVYVEIDQQNLSFLATVLKGGEKLLLDQKATDAIVDALKSNETVKLWTSQSFIELDPEGFDRKILKTKNAHKPFFFPRLLFEWPE